MFFGFSSQSEMSLRIGFFSKNKTAAPIRRAITQRINKVGKSWSESWDTWPPIKPAIKLPSAEAVNHKPITWPRITVGANLVIVERPTGLKQSSPSVSNNSVDTSHNGETKAPPLAITDWLASTITPKPAAAKTKAIINLVIYI